MKEFFKKRWVEFMGSSFYRFWYALVWGILGFVGIIVFNYDSPWYLLIPASGMWYVIYLFVKMLLYAWIINPIKSILLRIKEKKESK